MRSTFRSLCFSLLTLIGVAAMAQNTVTVMGSVTPCTGTSYPVWIFSDPGTTPTIDTVINTGAGCSYSYTFNPINTSGGIAVLFSCDGGLTWGTSDSASYTASPIDTLVVNLDCGTSSCQASFTVQQAMNGTTPTPWQITTSNQSTASAPMTYLWWMPDGSSSTEADPTFTITQPGVYGICLTIASGACSSVHCDTIVVDSSGFISTQPVWYDCLGDLWGANTVGSLCSDTLGGLVFFGNWDANCICQPGTFFDCLGVAGGTNLPGTACTGPTGGPGIWSADCTCVPDTSSAGCNANFWVIQAYDSTAGGIAPIPNEVWVWNLSTIGNGDVQYLWNFGDGSSSTDPYPTHVYNGPGPFVLCLSIYSMDGCYSTYCDSISIDANGILNGMVIEGHHADQNQRTSGFTINVLHSEPTGIEQIPAIADLRLWPNPAQNELNLTFNNTLSGTVSVTVIDPSGRTVISEDHNLTAGSNTLQLNTGPIDPGLYMVRIGNAAHSVTHRFMKLR